MMMMRMRFGTLACALATATLANASRAQVPHAGAWVSSEVALVRSSATCAHVEVTQARYELVSAINRSTSGIFSRTTRQEVWSAHPGCKLPAGADGLGLSPRMDTWGVLGSYADANTQHLTLTYMGCLGACTLEFHAPSPLKTTVSVAGTHLIGRVLPGVSNTVRFSRDLTLELDEAEAGNAFWALYKPLVEGNCNQFINQSLAVEEKKKAKAEIICTFSHQLRKLHPSVVVAQPAQAYAASLGTVQGLFFGFRILSPGDVLLSQTLVLADNMGLLWAGAILRKQENGAWKIVDLVII